MFGLFKKKSDIEILESEYKKLMEQAYKLQSINRAESDQKYFEADTILTKIKILEEKNLKK